MTELMRCIAKPLFALVLVTGGACKDAAESKGGAVAADAPAAAADASPAEQDAGPKIPSGEAVLERAVEAVGGRAALDRIESFYLAGEIAIPSQNISGDIEIWWKNGDFYTEQKMAGIGRIRAGKSGSTIWSDDPIHGLRRLEGAEAEQHAWASSLLPAADWKRYFERAETVKERELDGATVYDVKLTSGSGAEVMMTFDAESGLQVEQKYEQVTPLGKMPVSVKLEDYREVQGVKVAFKQVTDATLAKATQTITKVELGIDVDSATFGMPVADNETVTKDSLMPFDAEGKPGKPVPAKP
jgi:hypothetical protein